MHEVAGPFAVRPLSKPVVLGATGIALLLAIVANAYLFRSDLFVAVIDATGGFVSGTLLANALLLLVVVYGLLGRIGGATAHDLGLHGSQIAPAAVTTLATWLVLNGVHIFVLAKDGDLTLVPVLGDHWRPLTAELLGQLFGNALFEEVMFRGCLLAQLALWLTPERSAPTRRTIVHAALWSQLWFALQHVPNRLAFDAWHGVGAAVGDLAMLWFAGLCFAALWVRTQNLLVAVGYHALGNCPYLLYSGDPRAHPGPMIAVLIVLVAFGPKWTWLHGSAGRPSVA